MGMDKYIKQSTKFAEYGRIVSKNFADRKKAWFAVYHYTVAYQSEVRSNAVQNMANGINSERMWDAQRSFDQDIWPQMERHGFLIERAATELSNHDKNIVHHIARSISDIVNYPTSQAQLIGVAKYLAIRLL